MNESRLETLLEKFQNDQLNDDECRHTISDLLHLQVE